MPIIRDAGDRLVDLPTELLERMRETTLLSWAPSTRMTYGSGVRNYGEFMSEFNIPQDRWLPMSTTVARAWIAARIGELSPCDVLVNTHDTLGCIRLLHNTRPCPCVH
jgi:hypothetical protein